MARQSLFRRRRTVVAITAALVAFVAATVGGISGRPGVTAVAMGLLGLMLALEIDATSRLRLAVERLSQDLKRARDEAKVTAGGLESLNSLPCDRILAGVDGLQSSNNLLTKRLATVETLVRSLREPREEPCAPDLAHGNALSSKAAAAAPEDRLPVGPSLNELATPSLYLAVRLASRGHGALSADDWELLGELDAAVSALSPLGDIELRGDLDRWQSVVLSADYSQDSSDGIRFLVSRACDPELEESASEEVLGDGWGINIRAFRLGHEKDQASGNSDE